MATIYGAACWAHARRKFHDIHLTHASPTTTEALARIGALYAIEDEIRGKLARRGPGRYSMICANGWRRRFAHCPRRARPRLRFDMRSHAGVL
jgi:hypothetical protein